MANVIHVLDKLTAELIAAGEVVERPSSVVKELLENAIDAGSSAITVEIKNGGVTFIRISDNGCGISREDVPTAFLRHATSKVRTQDDLDNIGTLGFRGEALASIAAVSRVVLLTAVEGASFGTLYHIEGGEPSEPEDAGCPRGTTITIRDLFYNIPARMKFLKKDVSEGNAVAGVCDRIAMSHPDVSIRLIRDGREVLATPGGGDLMACIYAVFGRDFANGMIPLDYTSGGIHAHGYICNPSHTRASRAMQHFFINGRYVKTRTAMAALEEAYKGSSMVGKFPSCVMHIDMPLNTVDVNVHPAKIEVRFVNERPVFDAVYHGVKSALSTGHVPASMKLRDPSGGMKPVVIPLPTTPPQAAGRESNGTFPQTLLLRDSGAAEYDIQVRNFVPPPPPPPPVHRQPNVFLEEPTPPAPESAAVLHKVVEPVIIEGVPFVTDFSSAPPAYEHVAASQPDIAQPEQTAVWERPSPVRFVGEAFDTYIIARMGEDLYFIDKHAAHERILYDRLCAGEYSESQTLLEPVTVTLSSEECTALLDEQDALNRAGFEIDEFGAHSVIVRGLPMMIPAGEAMSTVQELAGGLISGKHSLTTGRQDWIFHSSACRAAVKAGDITSPAELQQLAERILQNDDVRTCPHGRPVCYKLSRRELEKQFGRVK